MPLSAKYSPSSVTGWMMPVSLLTCMRLTSKVSFRIAAMTFSSGTCPDKSGSIKSTSKPSALRCLAVSSTALCSMDEVIICFFSVCKAYSRMPCKAILLLSVAPLVKNTSFFCTPSSSANWPRAFSVTSRAWLPKLCVRLSALPIVFR